MIKQKMLMNDTMIEYKIVDMLERHECLDYTSVSQLGSVPEVVTIIMIRGMSA